VAMVQTSDICMQEERRHGILDSGVTLGGSSDASLTPYDRRNQVSAAAKPAQARQHGPWPLQSHQSSRRSRGSSAVAVDPSWLLQAGAHWQRPGSSRPRPPGGSPDRGSSGRAQASLSQQARPYTVSSRCLLPPDPCSLSQQARPYTVNSRYLLPPDPCVLHARWRLCAHNADGRLTMTYCSDRWCHSQCRVTNIRASCWAVQVACSLTWGRFLPAIVR
jgi:hypothetical protein